VQDNDPTAGQGQYLTFVVSGDPYAIAILRVREIIEHRPITRVPSMPAHVPGVINLRGSVVPVVDLAARFGLASTPVGKRTCIVVVEAQVDGAPLVIGVIADSVREVVAMAPGAIEPPPAFGARAPIELLEGLGRVGDEFVLVLDVDRALAVAA
jgi:purine-binding chemotaxis protein CheW